jgi:hypothetical protein
MEIVTEICTVRCKRVNVRLIIVVFFLSVLSLFHYLSKVEQTKTGQRCNLCPS